MTAAAFVVLASAYVLIYVSIWLKYLDDRDDNQPTETLREWLGLDEGEQP